MDKTRRMVLVFIETSSFNNIIFILHFCSLERYPCFDLSNDDYQHRSAGDCAVRGVKKEALKFVINNCV
jgi:hypothetical protein